MKNKEVESILLVNKFLTMHQSNKGCCYFVKKIIDSKIASSLDKKPSLLLLIWILGFILSGRSGLWS
jgi:hypothetical protein